MSDKILNKAACQDLRIGAFISFLQSINHYLGRKLQPNKVEKRGNMLYEDCRFDEYKVLFCNCTIKQPCACRSVIPMKKLKSQFSHWLS